MLKLVRRLLDVAPPLPPRQRARLNVPAERVANIFAVGDIHGRLDLLLASERRIMDRVGSATAPVLIVFLGDYIDRGPDSRSVIDHLTRKLPTPFYRVCLCGNHEDAFLAFMAAEKFDPAWLEFGGVQTLQSYGIDAAHMLRTDPSGKTLQQAVRHAVPPAHEKFLDQLPVAISVGNYLFVHAGVRPGLPLAEQTDTDLMWIREPFLSKGPGIDMTVVHGHTPGAMVQYGPNRIGIDTGAFATGKLSVLHIGPHGVAEI